MKSDNTQIPPKKAKKKRMLALTPVFVIYPWLYSTEETKSPVGKGQQMESPVGKPPQSWLRKNWIWVALAVLLGIGVAVVIVPLVVVSQVAKSHIEGNTPKGKLFDEYLSRDLSRYFCGEAKDCKVEYEFLRQGPTQTGIAYPKYYLWAKCFKGGRVTTEGAVRLAAVEQEGFDVTHFMSRAQIAANPAEVASIFPASLVDKIVQKAR